MPEIAYTVSARCDSERVAREFVSWLVDGHLAGVIRGGASAAEILMLDPGAGGTQVEVRYRFSDRASFERYEREAAPALRAEGVQRFAPGSGITLSRTVGEICHTLGAP
ncbi:MAG: DUF4286 family protein [Phycisphaerales bacterium]